MLVGPIEAVMFMEYNVAFFGLLARVCMCRLGHKGQQFFSVPPTGG